MVPRTAELTARSIQQFSDCPGWKDWFVPLLRKLKDEIKDSLMNDLTEPESAKQRARYAQLEELTAKPELHLAQMKEMVRAAGE